MNEIKMTLSTTVKQWGTDTPSKHTGTGKTLYLSMIHSLPTTDLDAAKTLKEIFGCELTFIPTNTRGGDWYVWNGVVHAQENKDVDDYLATAYADTLRDLVSQIATEAAGSTMNTEDKEAVSKAIAGARKYAQTIRSASGLNNLKTRIRLEFQQASEYFDNDQQWAVMSDGRVYDLSHLDADPMDPDPTRPVARHLGICKDGEFKKPHRWHQALNEWTPDEEVQDYLRRAAGAALLGKGDAKNIVTLVGLSHTGKSTYINVLKEVFGTYAGALPATAIVQKYGGATNFEQHKARGKRFLYLSEPQKQRTDDAFLKNLSGGGETISTSEKGKDAVEWTSQCVLHIAANHIPKFDTRDNAIVERMNVVGFDHVFTPDSSERNGNLVEELIREEGSGIMYWILAGAEEYLELGHIPVPDSIRKRSQENVVESSAPLMWLKDAVDSGTLVIDTTAYMKDMLEPKDGYTMFSNWCFENGERSVTQKDWLREIEAFNKMPAEKKGKRSNGAARVWGVVPSAKSDARKLHLPDSQEGINWKAVREAAYSAPHEQ